MRLNRSCGHFLCCSFLHWSFVCVQSTKGSANKQDIHHLDRQNKLHTEENLNVSPRLIVSRPAAGEPALSPASVHLHGLLLDVRLTTRHRCEHSKLKHFKKHCCYINTLFVFVSFFLKRYIFRHFTEFMEAVSSQLQSEIILKWCLSSFRWAQAQFDDDSQWTLCNMWPAPSVWAVWPKKALSCMHWMNKESLSNGITIVILLQIVIWSRYNHLHLKASVFD